MSRKIIHRFGGAWWDTLFMFIKDNDQEFILDFVDRMPCDYCRQHFLKEAFNYNFNQKKEELYKVSNFNEKDEIEEESIVIDED